MFVLCRACHATAREAPPMVGPGLHGLFGRVAGTGPGFVYSPAMRHAGFAWTEEVLDRFLADPRTVVPGNRMAFPGVRRAEDRAALIDFLKRATK